MENKLKKTRDIKVVLIGDSRVGKSSILLRFVANTFEKDQESTFGVSFLTKILFHNDQMFKYQIWDTAGQEKFHSLASLYYKDANVAIVVYAIDDLNSFHSLQKWIEELKQNGPKKQLICIVGNKTDLIDNEKVSWETAKEYADNLQALFKLTSAKENRGISELFVDIAEELEKQEEQPQKEKLKLGKKQKPDGDGGKKSCC